MDTRQENRNIKKALRNKFPNYEITVKQGTGTACGWKNIKIITDNPEIYKMDEYGRMILDYDKETTEKFHSIERDAYQIIKQNGNLGIYYADDGYNTATDELLLSVMGKSL